MKCWVTFIADDDGFIGGIFDNENSAYECKSYYDEIFGKSYVLEIDQAHTSTQFTLPIDE